MFWTDPFAFGSAIGRSAAFTPALDVTVSEGDLVLTMDLPGFTSDDLSVELVGGQLIVRGERARPAVAEGTVWAHSERTFGRFERRVRMPDGVDPDSITASMDNGVLSLIVPKPERLRPRTISIGSSDGQRRLETANA
jgi:HSP20 family protein